MFEILQVLYLKCTVSAFEYNNMVIHEINMSEDFILFLMTHRKKVP